MKFKYVSILFEKVSILFSLTLGNFVIKLFVLGPGHVAVLAL